MCYILGTIIIWNFFPLQSLRNRNSLQILLQDVLQDASKTQEFKSPMLKERVRCLYRQNEQKTVLLLQQHWVRLTSFFSKCEVCPFRVYFFSSAGLRVKSGCDSFALSSCVFMRRRMSQTPTVQRFEFCTTNCKTAMIAPARIQKSIKAQAPKAQAPKAQAPKARRQGRQSRKQMLGVTTRRAM